MKPVKKLKNKPEGKKEGDKLYNKEYGYRSNIPLRIIKESVKIFQRRFIGKTLDVLWEQRLRGVWSGLTGNYIKIYAKNGKALTNLITPVELLKIYRDGVYGKI